MQFFVFLPRFGLSCEMSDEWSHVRFRPDYTDSENSVILKKAFFDSRGFFSEDRTFSENIPMECIIKKNATFQQAIEDNNFLQKNYNDQVSLTKFLEKRTVS